MTEHVKGLDIVLRHKHYVGCFDSCSRIESKEHSIPVNTMATDYLAFPSIQSNL